MITALAKIIILVGISSVLGALGVLFFKFASNKISFRIKDWIFNWKLILGLMFYAAATILLVSALKMGQLSVVYPMYALSYFWVALFSQTLLKEKITALNWIGTFLIIAGIALTTFK